MTTIGFQVMPPLSAEQYESLEQSIREHGVQVPVTLAEDGRIVDGHHRKEIADRLHIHCPRVIARGTDTELRTLAFELNNHRRHLTQQQVREQIAKSIAADPQLSDRQHARRIGVHNETVAAQRRRMVAAGEVTDSVTRIDSLGRQQPARVEPTVNTKTGEVSDDYVTDQADLDSAHELPDEGVGAPRDSGDAEPSGDEGLSLPSPSPRSVTGLDGKTYTRPEAQTPRRRPITDAFLDKRVELHKTVEALCRLTQDDRFPLNAEKVATANRSDLIRSRDLLQQVIDSIPEI